MPNPLEDISAYRKQLAQTAALASGRFDLVLAFSLTSFFGVDVANELNLPSVWRIGETERLATVVHWLGGRLDPAVGLRAHFAFETASAILFVSRSTLRLHRPAGSAGRFAVLRNGVDLAAARAYIRTIDRDVCRRSLGIEREQRLLVCAGTVWPIKGQALLLAALRHICQDHPQLACVLIGEHMEPYAGALSRLIERGGLPASVRILPFCDDLRPWWRAADAAVCPSESEALPTSILEAMAFGLPVLASRVGGIPEIVEDGATGWLCEPNDLGSMIAGVTRVAAAEASELRRFGERGQKRVARAHDRLDVLSRMIDLLRQVSRGSSPLWLSATSHRVENVHEILRRFVERQQWRW
jgi:glycosyltransferase involved in cell wall biosynthesis